MRGSGTQDKCRWYVVQTKPKQEGRAESNLRHWGIQTLAPRLREYRHGAGATSERLCPLFPNYLFAHFDAEILAAKIRLTRGVQRIVGLGEYATPIDDEIIAVIRSRISEDGIVRDRELRQGDAVEIVSGPLRSLAGIFERRTSAHDRVVILMTTVAGQARVQVPAAAVRHAPSSLW